MKLKLLLFQGLYALALITISCTLPSPQNNCPATDTIYQVDTVDLTCYPCIDSFRLIKEQEIATLKQEALDQVNAYIEITQRQIDSQRTVLTAWFDSTKNTRIYDNMIVYPQGSSARVFFDSITGKPVLEFY